MYRFIPCNKNFFNLVNIGTWSCELESYALGPVRGTSDKANITVEVIPTARSTTVQKTTSTTTTRTTTATTTTLVSGSKFSDSLKVLVQTPNLECQNCILPLHQ